MSECFRHAQTGKIASWDQWGLNIGETQRNSIFTLGRLQKVPCVLMKDPSDMTEEERTQFNIFSPLLIPVEPITLEKMLLGALLVRYAKDEKGRGQLKEILVKYLNVVGDTLEALAKSGSAHWTVAAMNTKVTLRVYKNLGLMTPMEAAGLEVWINQFVAGLAVKDVIGSIGGLSSLVFSKTKAGK